MPRKLSRWNTCLETAGGRRFESCLGLWIGGVSDLLGRLPVPTRSGEQRVKIPPQSFFQQQKSELVMKSRRFVIHRDDARHLSVRFLRVANGSENDRMYGRWTENLGEAQSFSCYADARKRADSLVRGDGRVASFDEAQRIADELDRELSHEAVVMRSSAWQTLPAVRIDWETINARAKEMSRELARDFAEFQEAKKSGLLEKVLRPEESGRKRKMRM